MSDDERLCSIALTQCPGIGAITAKRLVEQAGSASEVMRHPDVFAGKGKAISPQIAQALGNKEVMSRAEDELRFIERFGIRCLTLNDDDYPYRLRDCADAPIVLYFSGNASLNAQRILSVVGTRHSTDYGNQACKALMSDLAKLCPGTLIVSGLAYGIDIHAQRAAMDNGLPTVAVLAHGLDRIYPPEHRQWAQEMRAQGGLLTEFLSGTNADRYNFISRNRIIAGLADATLVVESAEHGGALTTARLAASYNRDVFALPGRTDDHWSQGCNCLIRDNKAALVQNANDLAQAMGWIKPSTKHGRNRASTTRQGELFPPLSPEEQKAVDALNRHQGEAATEELALETSIPIHKLKALLVELEFKGVVKMLAGDRCRLA